MNGIAAAFTGRTGNQAELKFLPSGAALLSFSVAVDAAPKDGRPEPVAWVRVSYFKEDAGELVELLTKGSEVYIEGSLRLNQWQGNDGREHTNLNVTAWKIEVLGLIGRKAPKTPRSRDLVDRRAIDMYAPSGAPTS